MYICVTHVDSRTKIPGTKAPMRNGPTFPDVKGLNIEWWDESNWPLTHPDQFPRFYGTCDDDADTDIPGVVFVFDDQEDEEGEVTTAEELYLEQKAQEERARLPKEASPMRLRLALLELGLLDTVMGYYNSYEDPIKSKIAIYWEYSDLISKNHSIVQRMAEDVQLTEEQVDEIFITANSINDDPWYVEPTPEEDTPE